MTSALLDFQVSTIINIKQRSELQLTINSINLHHLSPLFAAMHHQDQQEPEQLDLEQEQQHFLLYHKADKG